MTDPLRSTATDEESEREAGADSPGDALDRTGQHASADVAPELFGW
jgi:hypothetical protein